MKRSLLFAMGALLGGALLFTSCGKEEKTEDPDVRDAAVGNFNGTVTTYWLVDGAFEADEDTFGSPESINLTISKDGTRPASITV